MISEFARDIPYMKMIVNLLHAGNIIDYKVSKALKQFEITHIQFNILRILEAAYPKKLSVGDINNGLLLSSSDVTRLLDRLEKRGLILRTLCPENRRKMDISITKRGLAIIEASLPKIEESLDGYYKNRVTEVERDQLLRILKKLKD